MDQQATADFGAFTAPDPDFIAAQTAEREKQKKSNAKDDAKLKPAQIKAAKDLADSIQAEKEAGEKFQLIQTLHDYVKLVKEYHPERFEFIKAPKNFGPKNSVEELKFWIKDIQNELGKKGGLDIVKVVWVEGFKFFEKINEGSPFGLNVNGIGTIAANSVTSRMDKDGTILVGPAIPTLAEFCTKHNSWFSSDVDIRTLMMAAELVAGVHRMNTSADINVKKAAETPVSKASEDLMKKL